MANLASSGVSVQDSWHVPQVGTPARKFKAVRAIITLSTMGSASNKILATAFGLSRIVDCTGITKSDDTTVYSCVPSYDGSYVIVKNHGAVTPLDISGTFSIVVTGEPSVS